MASGRLLAKRLRPIADVAAELGYPADEAVPVGRGIARLSVLAVKARARTGRRGRLVLVTAMSPTEHGEGKTVVTIGLSMALCRRGRPAVACLRQPSLGPVFGVKGGASGGGRASVEPRPTIDLGFTGDLDVIANAQNLLVSLVDNAIFHGNRLGLDPSTAPLPRASVLEDRALRDIGSGVSVHAAGFPRPGQFVIAPACEMAAVHGLAADFADLKARIDRMLVGRTADGAPVRAGALGTAGSVASLLAPSLAPNLVTTAEGTPALVHGIPYANVAHGTCSRLAMEAALFGADFAVVEAGFSTELGAEKFVDLVAPQTGFPADAAVLVVTVRSLEWHGASTPGEGTRLERGFENLGQHVANLRRMGLDPVIALNRFPSDGPADLERVARYCLENRLPYAIVDAYGRGGAGAEELADRVIGAAEAGRRSGPVYAAGAGLEEILRTIAVDLYGGSGFALEASAPSDLQRIRADGDPEGPVCIAKTPLSLSPDPKLRGRPHGFTVGVRRLVRWAGAGFTVAYAGPILAMPGLPERPAAAAIRLADDGSVEGLV